MISPYTRHGDVDSTLYSTINIVRTIERILGLPPMNQFDGAATTMARAVLEQAESCGVRRGAEPDSARRDERSRRVASRTREEPRARVTEHGFLRAGRGARGSPEPDHLAFGQGVRDALSATFKRPPAYPRFASRRRAPRTRPRNPLQRTSMLSTRHRDSPRLDAQSFLQRAHAVTGDAQFSLLLVLQAHQHPAVDGGEQLLDEADVHDGRPVDPREAPGVE